MKLWVCRLTPVVIACSWDVAGAQPVLEGLGVLPDGTSSGANAISADGSVVVGSARSAGGTTAFRWTRAGGMVSLGALPGAMDAEAAAVSADGSVIAGSSPTDVATGHAFRWTASSGLTDLGVVPPSAVSFGWGISGDGRVIVGESGQAARWSQAGAELIAGGTVAYGANTDGSVIVGRGASAFRWTAAGGIQYLGVLPGGVDSVARAVNADGSVVVGTSSAAASLGHMFRWTAASGMVDIGHIPSDGSTGALAVSRDGSVVVGGGYDFGSGRQHGVLWTAETGMVDLNTYLPTLGVSLTGWVLGNATGISGDGRTIVGQGVHGSRGEGWIITIPAPGGAAALFLGVLGVWARRTRIPRT